MGDSDDGIVARSLDYLFKQVARRSGSDGCRYTLRVSFAEIYNEQIYDLIRFDKKPLQVGRLASPGWCHVHAPYCCSTGSTAHDAGAVGCHRRLPRSRPAEAGVHLAGGCAAGGLLALLHSTLHGAHLHEQTNTSHLREGYPPVEATSCVHRYAKQ